ncbi:uncharacterized protein H6S33_005744 [Morchella sextelata]|uniref:uncharacterized protein n=1 Tax=Morchella sextelata TaxID=1174677 RepID=UPI001D03D460|nr:uncharacterized protein H6S33_005744 [Morchella sextelata]KAH0613858.1 hypothetical protein H6S33_005744 [Morchella sextelata]
MAPPYRFRSLTLHTRLVTLLLPLFRAVPTACFPASISAGGIRHGLAQRDPARLRTGPFVTTSPAVNFSTNKTSLNRNMMFIILGVVCSLMFLALLCFIAHCVIKALQRRRVRAASHSINTRRESTDSIWGITEEPHSAYARDDRIPYDYPQLNQTSLGTATISRGEMSEKDLNFPAWKSKDLTSPEKWNQPSPAYHEDGYTGIPPYDLEKGNNYSRESLPPMVPSKNLDEKPRDTTSAIIEDRFGPSVINRSETSSSYESYRKTITTPGARPPTTPKPQQLDMI